MPPATLPPHSFIETSSSYFLKVFHHRVSPSRRHRISASSYFVSRRHRVLPLFSGYSRHFHRMISIYLSVLVKYHRILSMYLFILIWFHQIFILSHGVFVLCSHMVCSSFENKNAKKVPRTMKQLRVELKHRIIVILKCFDLILKVFSYQR